MVSLANLLAASLQITCVAVAAGAVSAVLRINAPGLRYGFWRGVLLLCLALPWLQTPRSAERVILPQAVEPLPAVSPMAADIPVPTATPIDWAFWLAILIVSGICLRGSWIAIGCLRLKRLRVAGDRAPGSEHDHLQSMLGTRADVRYVGVVEQPVTFGLFRPVVLLPVALCDQPASTRRAIITHELVHVARHDWCWVLAEELVRAMLWFHPAVWWLISRAQQAREEVVDARVVALTGRRREYLEALLAFADDVPLAPAPAFARRRQLFRRIMLLSTEEVMSARRIVASAVALVVVAAGAGWTATQAFPMQSGGGRLLPAPGPVEQAAQPASAENPIPAVLSEEMPVLPADAFNERGTMNVVLQTVVDAAGNVAELRLTGISFQLRGVAATFQGGADTHRQLEQFLEKSTFRREPGASVEQASSLRPTLEAFIESAASAVQRTRFEAPPRGPVSFQSMVQFTAGDSPKVATVRAVAFSNRSTTLGDGAVRVGGNIKPPVKLKDVRPVYPQDARDAQVQGVVILEARIDADGRVGDAQVLRSIPMLDQAALDAVLQWEFAQTLLNGQPVPVIMVVTIQFSLQP